ncbi:unnamed protein product [Lampetra fluviatilis]
MQHGGVYKRLSNRIDDNARYSDNNNSSLRCRVIQHNRERPRQSPLGVTICELTAFRTRRALRGGNPASQQEFRGDGGGDGARTNATTPPRTPGDECGTEPPGGGGESSVLRCHVRCSVSRRRLGCCCRRRRVLRPEDGGRGGGETAAGALRGHVRTTSNRGSGSEGSQRRWRVRRPAGASCPSGGRRGQGRMKNGATAAAIQEARPSIARDGAHNTEPPPLAVASSSTCRAASPPGTASRTPQTPETTERHGLPLDPRVHAAGLSA